MQKYIQNIGLLLSLILFACNSISAQNLQWSNPTKLKGGNVFTKVIGENEDGVFILRYRNRFYSKNIIIEKYDHRLTLEDGRAVDLRNARLLKLYMHPNGLLLIKAKYEKSERINKLIAQWYNYNLKPKGKPKVLATSVPLEFGDKGNFRIRISDNKHYLSFIHSKKNENGEFLLYYNLLSDSLKTLYAKSLELPYNYDNFIISDFMVSNSGIVDFMCGVYTRERRRIVNKEVKLFRFDQNQVSDFKIAPEIDIKSASLSYDRSNDRIILTGFYSEKDDYGLTGSLTYYVDQTNTSRLSIGKFSSEFISSVSTSKGDNPTLSEGFDIIKTVPRSDGGILIIAEQKDIATEDDIILVNGIPQSTSKNIFNYNELLLLNLDNDGFLDWYKVITKNQTTVNDGGYFSSVVVFVGDKFIQLLYNDQLRSTGDVMKYTVYNNGAEESTKLLKTELDDVAVIPSESLQVSSNKMIIPTSKNRRFALLKLQYP